MPNCGASGSFSSLICLARVELWGTPTNSMSTSFLKFRLRCQYLATATGLKVGAGQKGGFEKMREDSIAKRQRRAESLEVGKYEKEKIALLQEELRKRQMNYVLQENKKYGDIFHNVSLKENITNDKSISEEFILELENKHKDKLNYINSLSILV